MLANLLVEPLEDLPAELEEPSKDQMLVLEGREVHLPQLAVQVEPPLVAFLEEREASLAEPVASLEEVLAYQVVLEAYPEVQVAFQEEVLAY